MKPNVDLFDKNREFDKFCVSASPNRPSESDYFVKTLRGWGSHSAEAMQIASIVQEGKVHMAASPVCMQLFKQFWHKKIQDTIKRLGNEWVIVRIIDASASRKTRDVRDDLWDGMHDNLDAKLHAAGITAALGGLGLTTRLVGQDWFYQPHAVLYMLKDEAIGGRHVLRRRFAPNEFVRRPVTIMSMTAQLGPQSRTIDAVFYANWRGLETRKASSRNAGSGSADVASAILRAGATAQIYTHNFRLEEVADNAVNLHRVYKLPKDGARETRLVGANIHDK